MIIKDTQFVGDRGSGRLGFRDVASVDDGVTDIWTPHSPDNVEVFVNGAGVNYTLLTPASVSAFTPGRHRACITNASSEYIGVQTPAAPGVAPAHYWRVAPLQKLWISFIGGAGVGNWLGALSAPGKFWVNDVEDFLGGVNTALSPYYRGFQGTAGSLVAFGFGNRPGGLGVALLRCDIKGNHAAIAKSNSPDIPSYLHFYARKGVPCKAEYLVYREGQASPDAGSEFLHQLGFLQSVTTAQSVNSVCFTIDRGLNIQGRVRVAGSDTVLNPHAAIPASTTIAQHLDMEINSAGTRVDFWCNGIHFGQPVGGYTLPRTQAFYQGAHLIKTDGLEAGATQREDLNITQTRVVIPFNTQDRSNV